MRKAPIVLSGKAVAAPVVIRVPECGISHRNWETPLPSLIVRETQDSFLIGLDDALRSDPLLLIALSTQGGSRTLTFLSCFPNGAEVTVVIGESGDRAERPKKQTRSFFAENQRQIGAISGQMGRFRTRVSPFSAAWSRTARKRKTP